MSTIEILWFSRDYYKWLHANKADNLEEIDKLLGKHNLWRLNHEKLENTNRSSISNELVTLKLPTNNSLRQDSVTG